MMTHNEAKGRATSKIVGIATLDQWNRQAKKAKIKAARELGYDKIISNITDLIMSAPTELEADRIMITCRRAM